MRIVDTVIYTDKLPEIRAFYERYFDALPMDTSLTHAFGVALLAEARLTYLDAQHAAVGPTQGLIVRVGWQFPNLERARLMALGLVCSELAQEDWGAMYGTVRCFSAAPPDGNRLVFFEDHYGESKQITLTADGTGTRKVHQQGSSEQTGAGEG